MCHLFIYSLLLLLKQIFKIKKKKEGRYKMKHRSEIEKGRGERVKKFKKIEEGPATNSLFRRRSNGGIPFPFRTHRCFCSAPSLHFTVSSIYVWFSILFPFFFLFSSLLISSHLWLFFQSLFLLCFVGCADRSLKMNGCLRKILKENAPERYRRFVIIPTLPLPYSLHQMHPPILHRWNACCSLLILVATS